MSALAVALLALQVAPLVQLWRPDERVVLADYSRVRALAATPFHLYIATTGGLADWDRTARRFDPPSSPLDGYPTARVRAALAAPDGSLWLATDLGWARYEPTLRRWDGGVIPGGVRDLAMDPRDPQAGIYLRSSREWLFLPSGSAIALPGLEPPPDASRPLSVEAAMRAEPAVDAMQSLLLSDETLRRYALTAAARTPDRNELFLGTDGGGAVMIDLEMLRAERLVFGLPGSSVAALAPGRGALWALLDQRGGFARRGFAMVGEELQSMRWYEGRGGLPFARGRAVAAYGRYLWAATDGGLLRLDPETGDVRMLGEADGLPGDDVRAVAAGAFGLVVGTRRGLAVVTEVEREARALGTTAGDAVLALLPWGDTVWVGLERGLGFVSSHGADVLVPPGARDLPRLRMPVLALTAIGDTVVAATASEIFWRDPATSAWQPARLVPFGSVVGLASDERGLWVIGVDDVAHGSLGGEWWSRLAAPSDLPARPTSVVAGERWLWVGTERGLVRFDRAAIGRR